MELNLQYHCRAFEMIILDQSFSVNQADGVLKMEIFIRHGDWNKKVAVWKITVCLSDRARTS